MNFKMIRYSQHDLIPVRNASTQNQYSQELSLPDDSDFTVNPIIVDSFTSIVQVFGPCLLNTLHFTSEAVTSVVTENLMLF